MNGKNTMSFFSHIESLFAAYTRVKTRFCSYRNPLLVTHRRYIILATDGAP